MASHIKKIIHIKIFVDICQKIMKTITGYYNNILIIHSFFKKIIKGKLLPYI